MKTLEQMLRDEGLKDAIKMIALTQPHKLKEQVYDLESAIINLDWSSNRKAFEKLFLRVGGSFGRDEDKYPEIC